MSVTKLPNKKQEYVLEILDNAIDQEFDEIIIVGFHKKKHTLLHSPLSDGIKIIGALTMVQYELLMSGEPTGENDE